MRVVVTGGAGFIGSNLVDALLDNGHEAVVVDDFSTGEMRFLEEGGAFRGEIERLDLVTEGERLVSVVDGADAVFHLAANADVRFGWEAPRRDLEQNVIATHNVCEAMRRAGVRRLLFSSTGSVYGEAAVIPTPEDCPFPVQTSLYGASKAAAEGYIAAYAEAGILEATVFRFVSIMGPRYTHGHVVDFLRQLVADPTRLRVLGDGSQRKSYLDVGDCVAALLHRLEEHPTFEVYNLGFDGYCTVKDSVGWICERLGVEPIVEYGQGNRGWIGDNPFIWLDTAKMCSVGWKPTVDIRGAVERTVDYLTANRWVLERTEHRR
ncbi:MAG TPA: NAD-dependent epimerase/dehydratase family protein [Acidimicrobiales bacterium]|nr:NAD-dependent epimerase/dehydratase family protein [Acidimicrobiales bacterium]